MNDDPVTPVSKENRIHKDVRAWAGGREYLVRFDLNGKVISVRSYVWHKHGVYLRNLWNCFQGREMIITAACATRAALAKIEKERANG